MKCDGNVWKHVEMRGKYEDIDGHTNILHMYTYIHIYIYRERERNQAIPILQCHIYIYICPICTLVYEYMCSNNM